MHSNLILSNFKSIQMSNKQKYQSVTKCDANLFKDMMWISRDGADKTDKSFNEHRQIYIQTIVQDVLCKYGRIPCSITFN